MAKDAYAKTPPQPSNSKPGTPLLRNVPCLHAHAVGVLLTRSLPRWRGSGGRKGGSAGQYTTARSPMYRSTPAQTGNRGRPRGRCPEVLHKALRLGGGGARPHPLLNERWRAAPTVRNSAYTPWAQVFLRAPLQSSGSTGEMGGNGHQKTVKHAQLRATPAPPLQPLILRFPSGRSRFFTRALARRCSPRAPLCPPCGPVFLRPPPLSSATQPHTPPAIFLGQVSQCPRVSTSSAAITSGQRQPPHAREHTLRNGRGAAVIRIDVVGEGAVAGRDAPVHTAGMAQGGARAAL